MAISNAEIIRKAGTITTGGFTPEGGYGILKPEQAQKFIQQTFEATPLGPLVRHVMRRAKTGEIDKIGIGSRLLREKVENTDDGYRAGVNTAAIKYATTAVRLPWEITEETLRENIKGQNLAKIITDLMTTQLGVDLEDLYINGDEDMAKVNEFSDGETYEKGAYVKHEGKLYVFTEKHEQGAWSGSDVKEYGEASDADFLKINSGWTKQLLDGAHVVDKSLSSNITLDTFYEALQSLPNKFNNGKLRWIMSPHRKQEWERYLLNQAINNGGIITDSRIENPLTIPAITAPAMPDDKIVLTDPQNLVVVNTYDVIIRSTTEGKEAIMQDKRFYVAHLDFDTIIEELDAAAIVNGLK